MDRIAISFVVITIMAGCAPFSGARDPLSAGTAQMLLEKNKTSKLEILEAFGGPNVVAGDADGHETWTYDRMSYATSSQSMGAVAGGAGFGGSGGGGGLLWGRTSRTNSSSRTMTLFLYFKEDVLVDYKYRSSIY